MDKPILICGHLTAQPEHPVSWSIPAISGGSEQESLNGTTLKDIPWRKYQYVLKWEGMSKADFEALEDLINLHNDFGLAILFHYAKWRQTDTPIYVTAELVARAYAAGTYQEVTLTLTEQDSREMVS